MAEVVSSQILSLKPQSEIEDEYGVGASLWTIGLRRLRRDRLALIAMVMLLLLTILSMMAPVFANVLHVDPDRTTYSTFLKPGVEGHILGTDDLGRDHLVRLLYAGQVSLGIAFMAGLLSVSIGITLGVITGYQRGIFDDLVIWFITTLNSIPFLLLLLLISSIFRPTPPVLILVLGLFGWTGTMRLVRGETLSLREREFVVAARAIGVSRWRIMFVHIIPNIFSVIIVNLALNIGALILTESALSYLGFGVRPPTSSWGNMLTQASEYVTKGPHLVFAPGILIVITVLCMFVIGDGLRDAFDPKLKEKA